MFSKRHSLPKGWLAAAALAFGLMTGSAWADVDPPDRVARVDQIGESRGKGEA